MGIMVQTKLESTTCNIIMNKLNSWSYGAGYEKRTTELLSKSSREPQAITTSQTFNKNTHIVKDI